MGGNAVDDFLGRSSWAKMQQQPPNRNILPPQDNQSLPQQQHQQQQQLQQQQQQLQQHHSYSKMMGLMNLGSGGGTGDLCATGGGGVDDVDAAPTSYSVGPSASASAIGGFGRGGFNFGSSNQQLSGNYFCELLCGL